MIFKCHKNCLAQIVKTTVVKCFRSFQNQCWFQLLGLIDGADAFFEFLFCFSEPEHLHQRVGLPLKQLVAHQSRIAALGCQLKIREAIPDKKKNQQICKWSTFKPNIATFSEWTSAVERKCWLCLIMMSLIIQYRWICQVSLFGSKSLDTRGKSRKAKSHTILVRRMDSQICHYTNNCSAKCTWSNKPKILLFDREQRAIALS